MEEYEEIPLKGQKRDLQDSLDNLTKELRALHSLFRDAAHDAGHGGADDSHQQILEKLDTIIDQNRKIAEGIVAVADLLQKRQPMGLMPQSPQVRMPPPFMPSGLPPLPQPGPLPPSGMQPPPKKGFMR